jgi:hypothetical protein
VDLVEHDHARLIEMDQEQDLRGEGEEQGDEPGASAKGLDAIEHAGWITERFASVMPEFQLCEGRNFCGVDAPSPQLAKHSRHEAQNRSGSQRNAQLEARHPSRARGHCPFRMGRDERGDVPHFGLCL